MGTPGTPPLATPRRAALADEQARLEPSDNAIYVSLRDLARRSGFSVRSLRGFLRRTVNPLPHYAPGGGKIVVGLSEFDAWMAQHRRVAPNAGKAADLGHLVDEIVASLTSGSRAKETP